MAVGTALAIGAGITLVTKGVQAGIKKKAAKDEMEKQAKIASDAETAIAELQANRQEVINPAGDMANEYENLGVATEASKFQAEEADLALANTLDTIAATGGGAGGATALARMALESKRGISADIQAQEAANQKARAAGAEKVAQLKAEGEVFKFNAQESRDNQQLARKYSEMDVARATEANANASRLAANADMVGAVGSAASTLTGPGAMTGEAGNMLGGLLQSGV